MPKFSLITIDPLTFDGQTVPANTPIATIETNLPFDNVLSALTFRRVRPEAIAEDMVPAIIERKLQDSPKKRTADAPPVESAPDPDALNAADKAADDAEAKERAEKEQAEADAKVKAEAEPLDPSLDGLDERIARILTREGFPTRDDIAAKASEGFDWETLDDIGRAAKKKIIAFIG